MIRFFFTLIALAPVLVFGYGGPTLGVYYTTGVQSDVQDAIDAASTGNIIDIPQGSFTWTDQLTCAKAVHIRGAGAGKVLGRSDTPWTPATGLGKVFTVQSGLDWTAGEPIRIVRTAGERTSAGAPTELYADGTVDSYSGTTLTIDVSSITGTTSSEQRIWHFWKMPAVRTTITNNQAGGSTTSGELITLTESTAGSLEMSGIRFLRGPFADPDSPAPQVAIRVTSGGQPVLIHDCFFYRTQDNHFCIFANSNKGVIWNTSFVAGLFGSGQAGSALDQVALSDTTSWTTASTMGSADTTGKKNLYMENCTFVAWLNCADISENARGVIRHSIMDHAGIATHGPDTGFYGMRHLEIYNNSWTRRGYWNGETIAMTWFLYLRGGTGIIYNNALDSTNGGDYQSPLIVNSTIMNLQRNDGPNPCFGAGIGGIQYPAPRQVGFGYVTGAGTDGLGRTSDSYTYVGDSEPFYVWGNTGDAITWANSDFGGTGCTSPDSTNDYVVSGRDYFLNAGAKPGWTAYTYPHPLRTDLGPDVTAPTLATVAVNGATVTYTFSESVTGMSAANWSFSTGSLSALSGSGTTYTMTLSPAATFGGSYTTSYTPGTTQDAATNALASISARAVTNNTPDPGGATRNPGRIKGKAKLLGR